MEGVRLSSCLKLYELKGMMNTLCLTLKQYKGKNYHFVETIANGNKV